MAVKAIVKEDAEANVYTVAGVSFTKTSYLTYNLYPQLEEIVLKSPYLNAEIVEMEKEPVPRGPAIPIDQQPKEPEGQTESTEPTTPDVLSQLDEITNGGEVQVQAPTETTVDV